MASAQLAIASEPADALVESDSVQMAAITALASPHLVNTDALDMLRENARKVHADSDATRHMLRPSDITRANAPKMIQKMIEMEALPFVKLSDTADHRVYFGLSFDGVLGVHGNF